MENQTLRDRVLTYLEDVDEITAPELADALNVDADSARRHLNRLTQLGALQRIKRSHTFVYLTKGSRAEERRKRRAMVIGALQSRGLLGAAEKVDQYTPFESRKDIDITDLEGMLGVPRAR